MSLRLSCELRLQGMIQKSLAIAMGGLFAADFIGESMRMLTQPFVHSLRRQSSTAESHSFRNRAPRDRTLDVNLLASFARKLPRNAEDTY